MDVEELSRNVETVIFKPCVNCEGQFDKNPEDDYQTYGRIEDGGDEADFQPS
tara:strand:- start:465 stop:620 length:156 start_codon:yes stop_codon:yes gene_type:complete